MSHARQAKSHPVDRQLWLLDLSHAPHRPAGKVFFGALQAILELQKKCGYAGTNWLASEYEAVDNMPAGTSIVLAQQVVGSAFKWGTGDADKRPVTKHHTPADPAHSGLVILPAGQ